MFRCRTIQDCSGEQPTRADDAEIRPRRIEIALTPKFLAVVAGVWTLLFSLCATAAPDPSASGTWVGNYTCAQGTTGLTLIVDSLTQTRVRALFDFYADPANALVPDGCFEMDGTFDPRTRHIELKAGAWLHQPFGYVTVDLSGNVSPDGTSMSGTVAGPFCTDFQIHHVDAPTHTICRPESTKISRGD